MIYFNVDDCVYIPNISDFIQLKNLNNEKQNFWSMFLNKYPGYDEKYFKLIYKQLNSVRINFDEYLNIDRKIYSIRCHKYRSKDYLFYPSLMIQFCYRLNSIHYYFFDNV